ncbi:MAG: sulfite exporter TauE/SafE family protein [Ilumatobacteraceae bacterium]
MSTQSSVPFPKAAIVGIAAGLLGGLFGVGGGLIIVPGLVTFAGMERRLAHGTSLAATLPIAAASLVTYLAHGNVDWAVALFLSIGAIAGAIIGTHLLRVIPKNVLVMIFVITVLATATRLLVGGTSDGRADLTIGMAVLLVFIGVMTGTLAGMLGIGGGVILVPAMVVLLGMVPVVAKGTSVAVIVPTSIMGTLRNRKHANADIRAAAVVGGFGVITAIIGGTVAGHLSDKTSNIMFAALLLFVAITQLLSLRPSSTAPAALDESPVAPSSTAD